MVAAVSMEKSDPAHLEAGTPAKLSPTWQMVIVASIAAGVQFGWALQLSLLTPYVQLLGVPHKWAAFIWLCGPISGIVVQPIVGYYSDRCTSRFGRRRPFIAGGAFCVAVAVFFIGYAADIGHRLGDSLEKGTKGRAVTFFVIGFWILDVANNMLQGPCRALLADLAAGDHAKTRTANSFFSFFMAVGNVLGYAAGSYSGLHKVFPFTGTDACDLYCANLKSCFFISIALLLIVAIVALAVVKEEPLSSKLEQENTGDEQPKGFPGFAVFGAFTKLKKPMWILMLVTALNWIGWFPFLLFDTDWMGKEVYGGKVGEKVYDMGVRAGSLGLMLNAVVLGVASLAVEATARAVGGVKILWGAVNFLLAVGLFMTILVTKMAEKTRHYTTVGDHTEALPPLAAVKGGALAIFAVLGIPLAITYSMPFALASIYSSSSGAGQGLSLGVLNLSICIPQMLVSVVSGPLDAAFGGGNLPAFVMGAVASVASGIMSIIYLPNPTQNVSIN